MLLENVWYRTRVKQTLQKITPYHISKVFFDFDALCLYQYNMLIVVQDFNEMMNLIFFMRIF